MSTGLGKLTGSTQTVCSGVLRSPGLGQADKYSIGPGSSLLFLAALWPWVEEAPSVLIDICRLGTDRSISTLSQWQAGKNWNPQGPACSRFCKGLTDRNGRQCGQATVSGRCGPDLPKSPWKTS